MRGARVETRAVAEREVAVSNLCHRAVFFTMPYVVERARGGFEAAYMADLGFSLVFQ